jgi:hypothetical protein
LERQRFPNLKRNICFTFFLDISCIFLKSCFYLTFFVQNSLCVSAEICVYGDGALLAPSIALPFIDVPVEQDSSSDSPSLRAGSVAECKWSEFPLDLQLRIADLPPDSKLVFSLFAMTGAFAASMIASSVMPLFRPSKKPGDLQLVMKTGRTHALLWAGAKPDLNGQTPSHVPGRKAASLCEGIEEKVALIVCCWPALPHISLICSTAKLSLRAFVAIA